jgi:hypothetical protein
VEYPLNKEILNREQSSVDGGVIMMRMFAITFPNFNSRLRNVLFALVSTGARITVVGALEHSK